MAFAAAGFADALVQGADFGQALKSGIISGVSAAAFYGAGQYAKTFGEGVFAGGLTGTGFSMKIALHGLIGGISSQLQGGKFGHGFASAGFTALGTGFNNSSFIPGKGVSPLRVLIGAMIGGTASEMTGGKFANGAVTGAFSQLMNNELTREKELAAQKGADPDIGGYSPVSGEYFTEDGELVSVNLQVYGNGNEALISADGLTSYSFDHQTGLLVNPLATGAAESVCPSCYLIGGGSVKFGWGALKSWVTGTLGGPRVGHRLFTATRKNGTWNTGKFRFGWSGRNGSDTYQFMFRYKQHHIPTGIKTTRAHPSGG